MKTIIVISPEYLTALQEESDKYSFCIQGYGSFSLANNGLIRVNSGELLGVAYVSYALPSKDTQEYTAMLKFLRLCDLMDDSKKMIFVLQTSGAALSAVAKEFTNLRIFIRENEELITDATINKGVFGSILLDNTNAYKLEEPDKETTIEDKRTWLLQIDTIVNPGVLECMSPIDILGDVQLTLENDCVYNRLVEAGDHLLSLIRKKRILKEFGIVNHVLNTAIEQNISTIADEATWCVYHVLSK